MRILSLIASSTEMVCALGLGEQLVGRSHECDFPDWVRRLPPVTSPRFATGGSSGAIDARVRGVIADALSVYRVDAEALAALAPDVVITQTLCAVCAVSLADVEAALGELVRSRPQVVALEPNILEDVWADLRRVAAALGVPERGEAVVAELRARLAAIAAVARGRPRPRVAFIEWCSPLMAAGNWLPELVALAGGDDVLGTAGGKVRTLSPDDLRAADPDVIVISPCGFDLARTREDLPVLEALPGWAELRAVRGGRVALADGNAFFNRPGPRLVESCEILLEIFHGEQRGQRGNWEWARRGG